MKTHSLAKDALLRAHAHTWQLWAATGEVCRDLTLISRMRRPAIWCLTELLFPSSGRPTPQITRCLLSPLFPKKKKRSDAATKVKEKKSHLNYLQNCSPACLSLHVCPCNWHGALHPQTLGKDAERERARASEQASARERERGDRSAAQGCSQSTK